LANTESQFFKDISKNFGKNKNIDDAVSHFFGELEKITPDGVVDLAQANQIKRAVGKMGSWNMLQPDQDLIAKKDVANSLYNSLKEGIEKASGTGRVKELNKQMSEIIPIENALTERIPVTDKNNIFSLGDLVTASTALATGPKGWSLFVLNKLAKSPKVAKVYRAGEKIEKATPDFLAGSKLPTELKTLGALGSFRLNKDKDKK